MSTPPDAFVADAALRFEAPPSPRRRARQAAAVLVAVGLELGVFALIWFERQDAPPVEPVETPVEIVVEPPPPPPPPPPTPSPEAKPQQADLTPGVDAPREGKSDHDDEQAAEKEKPAAPPPPPPEPSPSPEATAPAAPTPAPELPQSAEAEAPPPQKQQEPPTPAPPAKPTVAEILAKAFADNPEIDLGGAAMKAPIAGGRAKATYLSILYGMTKAHERIPAAAYTYSGRLVGVINVTLDGNGHMLTRYISRSSGSPELDEAEMQAIADASRKFPPPPGHAPIELSYTFGLK